MKRIPMVLPLLIAACAGKPLPDWKTDPTPAANAKRIDHLERAGSNPAWQRSPYWRVNDNLETPIYLIVADDQTACVVPAEDWTVANRGDFYPCPGQWRIARQS